MDHGAGTGVQGNNLLWVLRDLRHRTTDAFELWCWRWLFKASWTARRSNQSTLKEISPEYALEGLILSWNSSTLAIWCEELTHWKRPWCWERLKAGGEGHDRGRNGWVASSTPWTWVWVNSGSWWWTGKPGVLQSMGSQKVRHDWATQLNWTEENRTWWSGFSMLHLKQSLIWGIIKINSFRESLGPISQVFAQWTHSLAASGIWWSLCA